VTRLPKIKEWIDTNAPGDIMIPFSATLEHHLSTQECAQSRKAEEEALGAASVLPKIIVAGYNALQLMYYFTAGPDEVRAWTIRRGIKAPQAAGVIHTDFERGFIAAEVMKFDDLKELGNENAVKAAGKYNLKGKEYIMEDGDIVFFKFNVSNSGKKK
jgi:obg-like ATPase 1